MQKTLADKAKERSDLDERLAEAQSAYDSVLEIERIQQRVKDLEVERAWALVGDKRKELLQAKAEVATGNDRVTKSQEKFDEATVCVFS